MPPTHMGVEAVLLVAVLARKHCSGPQQAFSVGYEGRPQSDERDLARDLAEVGLLEPRVIESILRDQLRATRIADFDKIRAKLRANPLPPMTNEEINAEIAAYRAEQRRASGS